MVHFISAPSMTWRAALKMTKVKLELLTDVDMYNFVQRGILGGASYMATKYAKANNKEMKDLYDSDKPSSYISYIDAFQISWKFIVYLKKLLNFIKMQICTLK